MKTTTVKPEAPKWLLVDAEGKTIGRLSARIARIIRGKHKPTFSPHQLCGDHIVVINAEKLHLPPKKGTRKTYYRHTGYQGNMKVTSLEKMMEKDPTKVIELAVKGMLPANRLRPQILKLLHVFAGDEHPYSAQKPVPLPTLP